MANPSFEALLSTATHCHKLLRPIDHVVVGGLAVRLHGYGRESRDVDFVVRDRDSQEIATALKSAPCFLRKTIKKNRVVKAHYSPSEGAKNEVRIDFRFWSEDAKIGDVPMPNPAQFCFRNGLPALKLHHLIENKLACAVFWQGPGGKPRRAPKHLRDVGRLIIVHNLDRSYADNLHPSIRDTFRELVDDMPQW